MNKRVYLIHGLMGTSDYHFSQQIQAWQQEYDLVPLDLPGHGSNPENAPDPFFQGALTWVQQQIETQGKGHILGLSLGASIAIHLALEHPELCESIVLTGYAPVVPEDMTGMMEEQYHTFLNIEENNPEVAEEFKGLHGERWFHTLQSVLKAMTFHYPSVTKGECQKLNVPTLALNGSIEKHERDAACTMADFNEIIKMGLIPEAGHTANSHQPEVYNAIVKSYWDGLHNA